MKMNSLWIRSQDRMNLVKINQVSINYQNNKQIIANYVSEQYENGSEYYELLGTYKSKERALEVLDEIQSILISKQTISLDCKNALGSNFTTEKIQEILRAIFVYEMPRK